MKYIGIVGSQRRDTKEDLALVVAKLKTIYEDGDVLVSGGCPTGGDAFANYWVQQTGWPILIYYPGKPKLTAPARFAIIKANYARNERIANRSDYLIACVAADRTGGTENTIKYFTRKCKREGWVLDERLLLV